MMDSVFYMILMFLEMGDWLSTQIGISMGGAESNPLMKWVVKLGKGWSMLISMVILFIIGAFTLSPNIYVSWISWSTGVVVKSLPLISNTVWITKNRRAK